jgi:hypothetical protein
MNSDIYISPSRTEIKKILLMSQDARRQVQRDLPGRIRQLNADLTAALASDSPGTVQFANELAPEIQHLQASLNSRTPRAPPPLKDVRNPVKKGAGKKKKDKEEEVRPTPLVPLFLHTFC